MMSRRLFSTLLLLFIIACSDDDNSTVQPPVPLTPDEQVVANVRAMHDTLEKFASEHGGNYGYWTWRYGNQNAVTSVKNPYTGETEPSSIRAAGPGQIGLEWYYNCAGCDGGWPGCADSTITAIGYRITGYGNDHMLITLESVDNVPAEVRYQHDATVANAYLVMDAAKRFADENNGVFSTDIAGDQTSENKTLLDLLPNGILLLNAFTNAETEPQDGLTLITPGAIGYIGSDYSGTGDINYFQIEGDGCDGEVIATLLPYTEYGLLVRNGCDWLRACLEQFAKASGHYPHDLNAETTPDNKTILDIYEEITWDHSTNFVNPFTQEHYVPSIGIATGKGAIGYEPIETAGIVTDYVITGRDAFNEIVRLGPRPLR
jgi:hypothetical protein